MPSFSYATNYAKNNGRDYNPMLTATKIITVPRPYYPWPMPEQHVLSNFDIAGVVATNPDTNPQIEDSGLRWIK